MRSVEPLLRDVRAALIQGNTRRALEKAIQAADRAPRSREAWRLLADAAEQCDDRPRAIGALKNLAALGLSDAASCWMRIGALEMKHLNIRDADTALQRALAIDPGLVGAWRLRAQLTGVLGRSHEMTDCLLQLVRLRTFRLDDLIVLAGYDPYLSDPDRIAAITRANSGDVLALLVRAREALNANRPAAAERFLRELIAAEPRLWEAQALLGEICCEERKSDFLVWHAALPPGADDCSRIWLARGLWLRREGDVRRACRCFREAVLREPEGLKATMQLGQTLVLCGEVELGEQFLERGKLLQQIVSVAGQIGERQQWSRAPTSIDDLETTGRLWEAWAWCRLQAQASGDNPAVFRREIELAERLVPDLPRTLPAAIPGSACGWTRFPLPEWSADHREVIASGPVAAQVPTKIAFVDEARVLGLTFEYQSTDRPGRLGHHVFETTGGGVAALDFDRDGWVDLYFPQGGASPAVTGPRPRDSLFRNLGGARFEEVTGSATIAEEGYSQGVAAGDIDNDGFPDLYVANIGRNRLFHNNGDGTFRDTTDVAGLTDQNWTSSCAIADLDGDGLPDLFDVNYVEGGDVFTALCTDERGEPRVCRPTVFEPALDRVWLSQGDGRFVGLQEEAGLRLPYGRGLGLVVADFNADRRLDVFVANDQGANYLLINEPSGPGGAFRFSDEAHRLGAALDCDGLSKAGMGIAAGDVNGDRQIDMFVSTFANETKLLYLSQPDGSYVDSPREAGLHSPTFHFLGFGTQFLDADQDGVLDLVILNGHIDEFDIGGQGHRMRPQFFRGRAGGSFVEADQNEAGGFFGVKRLGRGLATLDWNRDGLPDFVATYLDGPAALGTNRTRSAGHSLRLKLVGTSSSRDAIGSRVRIVTQAGDEVLVQLTAGDGYEACNERLIQAGLGPVDRIARLVIEWPSGETSRFEDVDCRETRLAVEGAAQLWTLSADFP